MNHFEDAFKAIGVLSTDEAVKQKIAALQALFCFDTSVAKVIEFTLKRITSEDLDKNITLFKFETIFLDKTIQKESWYDACLKIFSETLHFDKTEPSVLVSYDILTTDEFEYFILRMVAANMYDFDEMLSAITNQKVFKLAAVDEHQFYLMIPENILKKGGKLTVRVPEDYISYVPMFIGKKGANVKELVRRISSTTANEKIPVVKLIEFVSITDI